MNEYENKYLFGKCELTFKENETGSNNIEDFLDANVIIDDFDEKIPLELKGKISKKFKIYLKLCKFLRKLLFEWRYK